MRHAAASLALIVIVAGGCRERDGRPNGALKDNWTHKDLADQLKAKGITVTVAAMPTFDKPGRTAAYFTEKTPDREQRVMVFLCSDEGSAREQAGAMGEGSFTVGRFAIGQGKNDGSEELLSRVCAALK